MFFQQINFYNQIEKIFVIKNEVNNNNQKNKLQIIKQLFHINYVYNTSKEKNVKITNYYK